MYNSFMLPIERNGGKLGGVPVQVIRKDSQIKPEVANQVTDELLDRDNVAIITGVTFSNEMMAIYKKVIDNGTFLIGSNASPSPLAGAQCSPIYFNTNAQNDQRAEAAGKYVTEKGFKRVYTMAPNYQAGKDYIAGFKRLLQAAAHRRDLHAAHPARLPGRADADDRRASPTRCTPSTPAASACSSSGNGGRPVSPAPFR